MTTRKTPKRDDRRVERTRQVLRNALSELIKERGFEALTVKDIIDRANVGRATFYAHFENLEDLAVDEMEALRSSLKDQQRSAHGNAQTADAQMFAAMRGAIDHAYAHRSHYQALKGSASLAMYEQSLLRIVTDLVREDVRATFARAQVDPDTAEATVQFLAGGLYSVVHAMLDEKIHLSVEQIHALFRRLAIPAVRAVIQ